MGVAKGPKQSILLPDKNGLLLKAKAFRAMTKVIIPLDSGVRRNDSDARAVILSGAKDPGLMDSSLRSE